MALIHILDEQTANQIAAGEVVERPVNVVKELAENAVDAGSREIEIEIADGGLSYIRVTDDGCGMTPEDARLSIIRHATSKIQSVDNIYHIASLGFRGEALPSIFSVSKSSITTRTKDAVEGFLLSADGGTITKAEAAGAPEGTTVEVRELFYNVPARKKFLKSERAESSRINTMTGKLAMANPDVAFRLINNGRTVIETPGNGRLLDVMSALYGVDTAGELLPVHEEMDGAILDGVISKPSLLKSSRQYQTIIVNRRVVESAAVTKAVDNAYHSLLPKNGYPVMALSLTVPPESIDVNVHPQKREIKFSDDQGLFRLVYHAVMHTLTSQSAPEEVARSMFRVPGHDVPGEKEASSMTAPVPEEKPAAWGSVPSKVAESPQPYGNAAGHPPLMAPARQGAKESGLGRDTWKSDASPKDILSDKPVFPEKEEAPLRTDPLFEDKEPDAPEPVVPLGQIAKCFIVCQRGDDLFLIDQHAAHERVRYDRLAEHAGAIPSQELLVPYLIHADEADVALLEERRKELEELGISFEQAGPDVIRITAAPEDLSESDMERVMGDILVAFHERDVPSPETLRHRMLAYASCRGAIKRGDPLNIRQMRELISDLFRTSRPFVCPHGRPTIVRFTPAELGHLFKRP